MAFYTFTILFKKMIKKEQYDKKAEEKQNSATIMIFVDEKGADFPVKLKLQGESFEFKKENFKKYLMS